MKKRSFLLIIGIFTMFQLKAHVGLDNPQGGESYKEGDTVKIEWHEIIAHNTLNWDLYFSKDGGITWNAIASEIPVDTFSYQWIVPAIATTQGQIRIVQDNEEIDYEDISDNFTITRTTGIQTKPVISEASIYPNPMIDQTTVAFDNPENENYTLKLYDTQGHLERIITDIITDKLIVTRDNLNSGLYYFQLNRGNGVYQKGRLVVE